MNYSCSNMTSVFCKSYNDSLGLDKYLTHMKY